MNLAIETRQVETVEYVFFVDLAKVLVAFRREKPADPGI